MPFCPRQCAGSNQQPTRLTERTTTDVPVEIWERLIGNSYAIWRCGYCGFVWGEKLFADGKPYYARSAIGYFGGLSGEQGWLLTPDVEIPNYPDYKRAKRH